MTLYDVIGAGYSARRVADPRIAAHLSDALLGLDSIANVGAGAGSYELPGRTVVAIEPSLRMVLQRPPGSAPAIQAVAESLPLKDASVAAATAILTIHHWTNRARGLEELKRVARDRIVLLTWDPDAPAFWLTAEYFPEFVESDRRRFPSMTELSRILGGVSVQTIPVPHDCVDGFLGAYWRRPHAYLDATVRSGMSSFAEVSATEAGLERLRADLKSGAWLQRHGHLLTRETLDLGYRLVIARA